jgi:phage-related protein
MAGNSIGSIFLDLGLNTKSFNKELQNTKQIANKAGSSISSSFSKLGGIIAKALSVAAVVKFGQECVKAYNAQNEAEVKLTTVMQQRMNANTEMINSVKTLASEQQKLGVVGDEVTLSGAQQLATFMNNADALKTLMPAMDNLLAQQKGVNATQQDAVNIGNLMGKVMQGQTSALKRVGISFTQAEENVLKYGNEQQRAAMLAKVITNNVGQMNQALANTPQGQIQQVKNNFGDLKEVLGSLISLALVPILKVLNQIILKLTQAATAAKQFVMNFLGIEDNTTALPSVVSDSADSMADMADSTEDETKEAKKLKSVLAGFDTINLLNFDEDEADKAKNVTSGLDNVNTGALTPVTGKENTLTTNVEVKGMEKLEAIKNLFKDLWNKFKEGLKLSLNAGGFFDSLKNIHNWLQRLAEAIKKIVFNPELQKAAQRLIEAFMKMNGQIAGAALSIGAAFAENLIAGITGWLEQDSDWITKRLVSIANSWTTIFTQIGNTAQALGNVISGILKSQEAINITTNLIAGVGNAILGVLDIGSQFIADFTTTVTQPFINNQEEIKQTVIGTLQSIEIYTKTFRDSVQDTFQKAQEVYDTYLKPMWKNIETALDRITKSTLELWNKHINPVLTQLANRWDIIWKTVIQPIINHFLELCGKIGEVIGKLFNNVLAPLIEWFNTTFGPVIGDVVYNVGSMFQDQMGIIAVAIDTVISFIEGIVDAINLVLDALPDFWGNWETGMDEIVGFAKNMYNGVIGWFDDLKQKGIEKIKSFINSIIDNLNSFVDGMNSKLSIEIPVDLKGNTKKFGTNIPHIPRLARGGVVNQPTLALMGENNKKEAVMPLESNTGWIDMLATKLAGIINKQNTTNRSGLAEDRPVEIVLQLGDAKFGRAVISSINKLQQQTGKLLLDL